MRGEAISRMIGTRKVQPFHIRIARPKGTVLFPDGKKRNAYSQPFMPQACTDEFHPGGNSLCYSLQLAWLMGCNPIYLMGFTLQSGSSYFFPGGNPVTRRSTLYDEHRSLDWLRWFEKSWPGRAKLVAGWSGPIYEVFSEVSCDELLQRPERQGCRPPELDPEPHGQDAASEWHI
jgi:hypothetical protein